MSRARPILFSAPMVQAIRGGRKTQTRRVIKPQPVSEGSRPLFSFNHGMPEFSFGLADQDARGLKWWRCPYGQAGDTLWVKETHRFDVAYDHLKPTQMGDAAAVFYEADGRRVGNGAPGKTRVALHMQRRFALTEKKIVSVRPERLNDCSPADAEAEGIGRMAQGGWGVYGSEIWEADPVKAYAALWDSINGKGPHAWAANPWVWIVEMEA